MEDLTNENILTFLKEELKKENLEFNYLGGTLGIQIKGNAVEEYSKTTGMEKEAFRDRIDPMIRLIMKVIENELKEDSDLDSSVFNEAIEVGEDIGELKDKIINFLFTEEVKEKLLFEASVKNNIFTDFDWEINSKIFEKNLKGKVNGVKSVSLEFNIEDTSREQKVFSFEINKQGLNKIVSELNNILEKI